MLRQRRKSSLKVWYRVDERNYIRLMKLRIGLVSKKNMLNITKRL